MKKAEKKINHAINHLWNDKNKMLVKLLIFHFEILSNDMIWGWARVKFKYPSVF